MFKKSSRDILQEISKKFSVFSFLIFSLFMLFILSVFVQRKQSFSGKAQTVSLSLATIASRAGFSKITYGLPQFPTVYKESDLLITSPIQGVYEIKRNSFVYPCQIGDKHPDGTPCDPDRYEIRIPKVIQHIYGLGHQGAINQVEVEDFLDADFSDGHIIRISDTNRSENFYPPYDLRTPMLVLPELNVILAYMQPEVKVMRLLRDGSNGCVDSNGNKITCIVIKKSAKYPGGSPDKFVIVKGSNLADTYIKYHEYLKDYLKRPYKKPNYKAFGVNWETYGEYGCTATGDEVWDAVNKLIKKSIRVSTVTIGSGYYQVPGAPNIDSGVACPEFGYAETGYPVTESMEVNEVRYRVYKGQDYGTGLGGINALYNDLHNAGISVLLGMRHRVHPGVKNPSGGWEYDNVSRIEKLFKSNGFTGTNIWISTDFNDPSSRIPNFTKNTEYHYLLNNYDPSVVNTWIDLIRKSYGNFDGVKLDDLDIFSQRGAYNNWGKPVEMYKQENFQDDYYVPIYNRYLSKFGDNLIISSSNNWFSGGTDWEETDFIPGSGDYHKPYIDLVITRSFSGYPNSAANQQMGSPVRQNIQDESRKLEYINRFKLNMLHPATRANLGFWHLKNNDGTDDVQAQNVVIFWMQLRERLHQYMYDQSMRQYETGVPWSMQPLLFRFGLENEVIKQYTKPSTTDDSLEPKDEYMLGNALLVRPVFCKNCSRVNVYLPQGNWKPFLGPITHNNKPFLGSLFQGSNYYSFPFTTIKNNWYPIFMKEGEILVIGSVDLNEKFESRNIWAYVFLDTINSSSEYWYYPKSGGNKQILQAVKDVSGNIRIVNKTNGRSVSTTNDRYGKGWVLGVLDSILDK